MATALKLKRDINKLKAAIRSKATPQSYVPKLKAQLQKAEADYESVKAGKKSAPKASKQVKSTLDKLKAIIKKKKYGAYRAQGVDLEKDADRPALRSGKRTSKNGNTYYEYRANRIDVKQPPKRYPKLEDGGYMAKGGEITKEDIVILGVPRSKITEWDWKSILGMAKTLDRATFILKDEKGRDVVPQVEFEWYVKEKMADGGYMAKGGEIYKIQQKFKYDLQPKWEDEKFQTGGHYYLSFKEAQDVKKKLQGLSSSMEYKVVKVEEKMAGGGYMEKGGTIDNSGMTPADLQNQIWNLTSRIAKLGDIESRAASDEIEMLMKQRKKLQSMALNHGDVVMAQGGELHRSQEEKFKYGGYMAEGGVIELKSVGTYFRPSDLATSTDGTFSEDDMFYLSDIDNYEWWHGLSKEDRAKIEEHFDVDKHLMDKFETKDLDTYDKEAKEMKGGGYMAKGGKTDEEVKKYAEHYIKELGSVEEVNKEISKTIRDLAEDDAMSNVNQLQFFVQILFYLRYEYTLDKKEKGGYMGGGGKSDEENPFVKRWEKVAQDVLLNKKIVKVRYLTNEEQENLGWYRKAVVIQLQDGTLFFPSADDEGNDAGAIFFQSKDNPEGVLPVI